MKSSTLSRPIASVDNSLGADDRAWAEYEYNVARSLAALLSAAWRRKHAAAGATVAYDGSMKSRRPDVC